MVAVSINETMGTCWRTLHRHMYRPGAPQHIFLDKKARALSHFITAAHLSAATFTAIFCQNIQIQVGSELTIAGQKNNVLFQYHWIRSQKQERILGYAQWQEQGRTSHCGGHRRPNHYFSTLTLLPPSTESVVSRSRNQSRSHLRFLPAPISFPALSTSKLLANMELFPATPA
jgi:hypothetical protein